VGTAIFFWDVECFKIAYALNNCCLFFIDAVIFILFVVLLQKQSFFHFLAGFGVFLKVENIDHKTFWETNGQ